MYPRGIFALLLAVGTVAIAPSSGLTEGADNTRLRDLIENQAGFGQLGGPGNAIAYAVEQLSDNGCDIVVKETTTVVQRGTDEKLTNRYTFGLAALNPAFKWVPSMGRFLVLFDARKGEKLRFEGVGRTIPREEMKYRSTSVGFHFEDEDVARDFAKLARKMIKACQKG